MKTYEDMTLEELEDNEDEFNEEDERAIEMYRLVPLRGTVFLCGTTMCVIWKMNFLTEITFGKGHN